MVHDPLAAHSRYSVYSNLRLIVCGVARCVFDSKNDHLGKGRIPVASPVVLSAAVCLMHVLESASTLTEEVV